MKRYTYSLVSAWARLGPRFLPFADVASADVTLPRLLRLSLFQVSVGMALALMVGTLNRVMIVELHVPATLVASMVALPMLYAPFRALVGFRSDAHRSELGWRRVPYIWMGTMIQFGGLAIMPFALLLLSGGGNAGQWPVWAAWAAAALAFLLVGAGLHTVQTAGLALTTDLVPVPSQARAVGLMCVMLLLGTMVSALWFGAALAEFSPAKLVQVIQAAAVATLILNATALWKQEVRDPQRKPRGAQAPVRAGFGQAWRRYLEGPGVKVRLWVIALGTLAFGMQDVLMEPYGGQVLGMSVGQTSWISAALAAGGLAGFSLASYVLHRGADPARMATCGAALGIPAFVAVMVAASGGGYASACFVLGVSLLGLGAGLFSHGNLTLAMHNAPKDQTGLALGVWGAVQATAAGLAVAAGGVMRDLLTALAAAGWFGPGQTGPVLGYTLVYALEAVLLGMTVALMLVMRHKRLLPPRRALVEGG